MEMDFTNLTRLKITIPTSTEVQKLLDLMCLSVFVNGNKEMYNDLLYGAKMLGSAFQKVNFLRDIQDDAEDKGRSVFPGVSFDNFSEQDKLKY